MKQIHTLAIVLLLALTVFAGGLRLGERNAVRNASVTAAGGTEVVIAYRGWSARSVVD